jgi:hypothetical protein
LWKIGKGSTFCFTLDRRIDWHRSPELFFPSLVLQAQSAKEIDELLKTHPHFRAPGASVEVLEFLPMPGMSKA